MQYQIETNYKLREEIRKEFKMVNLMNCWHEYGETAEFERNFWQKSLGIISYDRGSSCLVFESEERMNMFSLTYL